jgi:hypothetical protein
MKSHGALDEPVQLLEPGGLKRPEVRNGCRTCAELLRQWDTAMNSPTAYDPSAALDASVQISRHPHSRRR